MQEFTPSPQAPQSQSGMVYMQGDEILRKNEDMFLSSMDEYTTGNVNGPDGYCISLSNLQQFKIVSAPQIDSKSQPGRVTATIEAGYFGPRRVNRRAIANIQYTMVYALDKDVKADEMVAICDSVGQPGQYHVITVQPVKPVSGFVNKTPVTKFPLSVF